MKILGEFKREVSKETVEYNISGFSTGVNTTHSHFINIDDDNKVKWVVDRVCDHAGGPLIKRGDCAVCPMHNWELDLKNLEYKNSAGTKKTCLKYSIQGEVLSVGSQSAHLTNPHKELTQTLDLKDSYFRWHNHACVEFAQSGISLITDPWLLGSSFVNGWWLKTPSRLDALEALQKSDYIYISHNHPDHLHPETLLHLEKDVTFIVPPFISRSTSKYLEDLGFHNIYELEFGRIYELEKGFQVAILKSGDFRDDSGLYVACGGKEFLLTVDANYLNGHILPKKIDYLLTSFAGGASGYPFIYDNFSDEEKRKIAKRNLGSTLSRVRQYLAAVEPTFYMPYAGMFETALQRDIYITNLNQKNDFTALKRLVETMSIEFIEPKNDEKIGLISGNRIESISDFIKTPDQANSLEVFKKNNPRLTTKEIFEYFYESNFTGNQILQIIQTNDDFEPLEDKVIFVQFGQGFSLKELYMDEMIDYKDGFNVMKLYVRYESFSHLIRNRLPWEDLTIGFQCRITRMPNIYEADFWYHFTNVFIKGIHKRSAKDCRSCKSIELRLDNQ